MADEDHDEEDECEGDALSPLARAIEDRKTELAKRLIDQGADIDSIDEESVCSALMAAAVNGNSELVRYLLEKKADIHRLDASGRSALHYAAESLFDEPELMQLLIDAGLDDIDVKSHEQQTPLLLAVVSGNLRICTLLLDLGADPNGKAQKENTPLALLKSNLRFKRFGGKSKEELLEVKALLMERMK